MLLYKAIDYQDMSRKAANIISASITLKPDMTLGLATGSSPIGIYNQLIDNYRRGNLDFRDIKTVNLDEYKGLSATDHQSYRYFMNNHLFDHVNIDKNKTFLPDGTNDDTEDECRKYNEIIDQLGGIDLQLLGLGHNGHIGFNEPGDVFIKSTHCVELSESTLEANSRLFDDSEKIPRHAYTMGIHTIMLAKKVLMVVTGRDKAEILSKVITGPITPRVPASILQLHQDVTVIADEAAFSLFENRLFADNRRMITL